ncbi:uncharacterized protein RAG0_17406 [Rhynchosporium agropyri]|uniref:Uncharacterized protein n=2 Tax=Rhynchosporium TaxID=38037 RepID=A0A1E1MND2_RHYSE|nr:uncharacterized protein RAG0_17406 [Rhynchosporium agropyri]CZT50604.1 uncharacterized protein RSE6_11620 [Rhynchosporium secalis]
MTAQKEKGCSQIIKVTPCIYEVKDRCVRRDLTNFRSNFKNVRQIKESIAN